MEADLATMEKKGMPTGFYCTHPLSGEKVEIWVGNYVLMGYGEGAVMGVPAHDERDFAFAKKYGLPIKQVIAIPGKDYSTDAWQEWYADKEHGVCVNSGKYDGLGYKDATNAIAADLKAKGLGRQAGAVAPARLGHLAPALLGHADPDHPLPGLRRRSGAGRRAPGDAAREPRAGRHRQPAREDAGVRRPQVSEVRLSRRSARPTRWTRSSTRPGTSLRFACPDAADTMVDERVNYWLPVDQYIGGIEHAILHLLYARFWSKVMRDLGLVKFDEPFSNLLTQGMVLNHVFLRDRRQGEAHVLRAGGARRRPRRRRAGDGRAREG